MSASTANRAAVTVRVVASTGDGETALESRRLPPPAPGELRLRLRACGLCGTDLFKLARRSAPAGAVLGHEVVGAVEAVGDGVVGFGAGDRVVVPHHVACGECALCRRGSETLCPRFRENLIEPGGFADAFIAGARAVVHAARKVPAALCDEAAVFLEPGACVVRSVRKAALPEEAGGAAVVLGAGSMGLLHLLVLRALHPKLAVIVCDPLEERLALARRLGAARAEPPGSDLVRGAVREASGGLGADAVFDTVGGSALLDAALELTREGGAVVLFAHAPDGDAASFQLNRLFKSERRVVATYSGSLVEQDEFWELLTTRRLDPAPLVTHRIPLSSFPDAVALSRSRGALKVLLVPEESASSSGAS